MYKKEVRRDEQGRDNGAQSVRKGDLFFPEASIVSTCAGDCAERESGAETGLCPKRLAELVAFVRDSPETQYFIPMIQLREAILSSRIEDIECSMDEVLKAEAGKMRGREVCLVQGLREAAEYALSRRKELPLCNRLVREAHRVLFGNVCETGKNPGEFRKTQNWIGPAGCTLSTASHVSPNVQDMLEGLANLENYINYRDGSDPLIRAALVHYQFETIKAAHHIVPS